MKGSDVKRIYQNKNNRTRIIRVKVDRFQMPQISYDPKSVFKFDFRLKIFYVELKKSLIDFCQGGNHCCIPFRTDDRIMLRRKKRKYYYVDEYGTNLRSGL